MKASPSLLSCAGLSALMLSAGVLAAAGASGQCGVTVFDSGSKGEDGTFAPTSDQVIDTSTTGVWKYSTIDIPAGVKVTFKKNPANTGVIWLAQGDVNIAGEIDLDGADGTTNIARGNEAPGGPGGFAGGRGGRRVDVSGSGDGTPGEGPGGGDPGVTGGSATGGQYGTSGSGGLSPPLLGGSGGGGSGSGPGWDGVNGGGGGGAILIASSTTISVKGSMHSNGGSGTYARCGDLGCGPLSGSGSGGAIRLVANCIEWSGSITAIGGGGIAGGAGRIKTEAFDFLHFTGHTNPVATQGRPVSINLTNLGTISITSIAGQVVSIPPSGDTASPDVIFSQGGPITVVLKTTNIPAGTSLTVCAATDGPAICATPSSRTDASGNASATLTVPAGYGTIQAWAEYTVTP